LVFTGAMDYWANVDAVRWFVQQVWPLLVAKQPELKFYIVGGKPTAEVQALASENIIVTGRVHDVRPYISRAALVVAPLRIARGIQNKVLEAMSMAKPIVATGMAMEGINAPLHHALQQSDDAAAFAAHCLSMLEASPDAGSNRHWVLENFTWQATLAALNHWSEINTDEPD
jgi:glycosyltransferase involved in cell wall biosynthesis